MARSGVGQICAEGTATQPPKSAQDGRTNNRTSLAPKLKSANNNHFKVTFPAEHIVQVTLDHPQKLNCIDQKTSREIADVWALFDEDHSLRVGIITGTGRAFCVGADLAEWNAMNQAGIVNDMSAPGLAGLCRRSGKKPIIAAINGITMGGGFEIMANCDLVIAASTATFALSEVKRGVVPVAGSLPRLTRTIGLQRTTELVLTGRNVSAQTLHQWGLINRVVESATDAVAAAIEIAQEICSNSPDAVVVGRKGIRMSWEDGSVESAVSTLAEQWYPRLMDGTNFAEGMLAFVEKRSPRWTDSKL